MDNNIRFFKYLIQLSGSMKDWISVNEIVRIICEALLIPWRKSLSYIRAAFCEENLTPEAYKCGSFLELTKTLSAKDFTTLSYRLPWNLMIIVSNLEDLYFILPFIWKILQESSCIIQTHAIKLLKKYSSLVSGVLKLSEF